MNRELDELLQHALLAPPAGFAERVMTAVVTRAGAAPAPPPRRVRELVEWLAVAATVLLGLPQLTMFLFGIWTVSSVG